MFGKKMIIFDLLMPSDKISKNYFMYYGKALAHLPNTMIRKFLIKRYLQT